MKTLAAILLIALVVAGITALPHMLGLHWWDYLLYGPLVGFVALVAMFAVGVYWEPRP